MASNDAHLKPTNIELYFFSLPIRKYLINISVYIYVLIYKYAFILQKKTIFAHIFNVPVRNPSCIIKKC